MNRKFTSICQPLAGLYSQYSQILSILCRLVLSFINKWFHSLPCCHGSCCFCVNFHFILIIVEMKFLQKISLNLYLLR